MTKIRHPQANSTALRKGHPLTKSTTILIVDDEVHICNSLGKLLAQEGYDVRTATSGAQAIDVARQEPIGLTLLDLIMPGMNGIRVLQEIKKIDESIVVIMMTGYGALDTAKKAMMLGAYDYITKPIDLEFLIQVIKEGLEEGAQEARK